MIKTVQEVLAQQRSGGGSSSGVAGVGGLHNNAATSSGAQNSTTATLQATLSKAKILVLGNVDVGKTAFIVRYLTQRYIGDYLHNKEVLYSRKVNFEKDLVSIEMQDTCGEMGGDNLEKYIEWADGCVCVYSVLDEESFRHVDTLYLMVKRVKSSGDAVSCFPMVAIANKIDATDEGGRAVSEHEGKRMARRVRCPVFECSVANNKSQVIGAMDNLLCQIRNQQILHPPTTSEKRTLKGVTLRVLRKKIYRNRSDTV